MSDICINPAWLLGLVPFILTVRLLFKPAGPPPIFGVYSQPNRWYNLKFCLAYGALTLRKLINRTKPVRSKALQGRGYGSKSRSTVEEMECPQELPADAPKAADAVYFVGANREGFYFVAAIARRPNRVINGFWYLRIPGVGLLKAPKLPDTLLKTNNDMEFSVTDGLLIRPVEPMKQWRISYDGLMKFDGEESKTVNVKMEMDWRSNMPYFDFDTDIPAGALARSIAREVWTRDFFESLKMSHQTHHEQMGEMTGNVKVEGLGDFTFKMGSMRDHSYATMRDWKRMNRYGLHSIYLEDGTKMCVGIVSQTDITGLEMGYLYTPNGKLYGVDRCDLQLQCHGHRGTPPLDYSFTFNAGGRMYRVECEVIESPELFLGEEWEARVLERMCKYHVNGIPGWGFAEWEYRNDGGKDYKPRL